jgi:outer membrane protein OmpA-like peptidoglycan-associated protein
MNIMKKSRVLLSIILMLFMNQIYAQDSSGVITKNRYFKFQGRVKGGAATNFKSYPNKLAPHSVSVLSGEFVVPTPRDNDKQDFLKSKWGGYAGTNLDFYFHKNIGFGVDVDYFNNKFKYLPPSVLTDFINSTANDNIATQLVESNRKNQQLIFVGIGPSAKLYTSDKIDVDMNVRVGLSHLRMGSLSVGVDTLGRRASGNLISPRKSILEYDYNKAINAAGLKVGLYVNYWFHKNVGVTAGIDYVHSFVKSSTITGDADYKLNYLRPEDFVRNGSLVPFLYFDDTQPLNPYPITKINVNHLALSAGLVFRVEKTKEVKKEPKQAKIDNKDIIVTVKDKFTGMPVDEVEVNLTDENGKILETKRTAKDGKVVFSNVAPDVYGINGDRLGVKTTTASVSKEEFKKKGNIFKELLYEDPGFILEGIAVECGNKDKLMPGVEVELTNKETGKIEKTTTDAQGKFTFLLKSNTDYTVVGSKDGYYSNIEDITTKGLDRNKTLYVKLKLCVEQLEVGKTFVLRNIYYDFDKCNIRNDASKELDHLVDIMKQYKNMTIELSSHTDQRGTTEYNQKLSQCRAESAVNYLIKKGIDKSRFTAVGFGESKLLQDCSGVAGCPQDSKGDCDCHQNNRRTEVKIIKL